MKIFRYLLTILIFSLLSGCKSGVQVSKADMGEKWPFTVENGLVHCFDGRELVFEANGIKYSLNGWAETFASEKGYNTNLKAIWARDPKYPDLELFLSIGPITDLAEAEC